MSQLKASEIAIYDYDAPDPRQYGINHEWWRTEQYPTVKFIANSDLPVCVVEQPTGSGKSAVARALGSKKLWNTSEQVRAIVLTRTKSLQDQYGDLYDAHLMKGKSNYPCPHPKSKPWQMADECLYAAEGMSKCPLANECPYMVAKRRALTMPFVATNYAYWLSAYELKKDVTGPHEGIRVLACDEAHLLSQTTLNWSGATIHEHHREKFSLPAFPIVSGTSRRVSVFDQLFTTNTEPPKSGLDEVYEWLSKAAHNVGITMRNYQKRASFTDDNLRKEARQTELFLKKITHTMAAINHSEDDWYVKSGPGVVNYRGEKLDGMVIKPLTARHQFERLFLGADRTLLMSATIGDPETYAKELGIDKYAFRTVPNRFPPESRLVKLLDAPKMGRKSTPADYERQADVIAQAINGVDRNWSGIIHVTRKNEAVLLAGRLARRGLQGRMWTPPLREGRRWLGTTEQAEAWELRKKQVPNSIMCCWQFWAGFDGQKERICVVAKTPFPFLGDPYEQARQRYSGSFYNQRTAWDLVQALGRTRRGRVEDYDLDGEIRGLVAIADGNWKRVRKYIPADVREAMVEQ